MAKILLWLLVIQIFYGFLNGEEEESFCAWLDKSRGHLSCKNGFCFPLDEKFLENIKKLSIHSENVTDLKSVDFKNLSGLTYLDLSKSNVQNIDQDAFVAMKHLKIVNLSHNKDLKISDEGPLFFSESLRDLILRDTGITNLPEDAFKEMPSLEVLNLQDNKLEDIETAIESAKSLEKLTISESNLDSLLLCERTSLTKIEKISLNSENKEVSNIFNCVTNEEELLRPKTETSTKGEETEESTTLQTNEEMHKEFCMDDKNFNFHGQLECKEEDDARYCQLSCPEEMKPDNDFVNPYKCFYNTGMISPAVPKCLQDNGNGSSSNGGSIGGSGDDSPSTTEQAADKPEEKPEEKVEDKSEENQVVENKEDDTQQDAENRQDTIVDHTTHRHFYNDTHDTFGRLHDPHYGDDQVAESKPEEMGVNGSSIVLGIIIVVLVAGALGMGYKYWKNHRGYHNARTEDVEEGKELKIINSANKTLVSSEQNE